MSKKSIDLQSVLDEGKFGALQIPGKDVVKKNRFRYAILVVGFAAVVAAPVIAGSLGGPLELADVGIEPSQVAWATRTKTP